jgi:cell division septation protein DedD
MEEEKYQKELFEFEQPKRSFAKLTDMLPKADFEGRMTMTFTMEKIVFISIGIMMAMVIVYAIGVENGKSLRRRAPAGAPAPKAPAPSKATAPKEAQTPAAAVPAAVRDRSAPSGKTIMDTAPVATGIGQARSASQAQAAAPSAAGPYSILAATFRNQDTAASALQLLRKYSMNAFIVYDKLYYRVYVGMYRSKNDPAAANDLEKVKRAYKDAFIKLR